MHIRWLPRNCSFYRSHTESICLIQPLQISPLDTLFPRFLHHTQIQPCMLCNQISLWKIHQMF